MMKKLFAILIMVLVPAMAVFATDTPTETVTPSFTETPDYTATLTATETPTITETATITPTFTVTSTYTITPTPQAVVYSFPNPVNTGTMGVAYPIPAGKTAVKAIVIIRSSTGEKAAEITDNTPNGYTTFPTDKFARGSYFYTLTVTYSDGSNDKYTRKKFAVVK